MQLRRRLDDVVTFIGMGIAFAIMVFGLLFALTGCRAIIEPATIIEPTSIYSPISESMPPIGWVSCPIDPTYLSHVQPSIPYVHTVKVSILHDTYLLFHLKTNAFAEPMGRTFQIHIDTDMIKEKKGYTYDYILQVIPYRTPESLIYLYTRMVDVDNTCYSIGEPYQAGGYDKNGEEYWDFEIPLTMIRDDGMVRWHFYTVAGDTLREQYQGWTGGLIASG